MGVPEPCPIAEVRVVWEFVERLNLWEF